MNLNKAKLNQSLMYESSTLVFPQIFHTQAGTQKNKLGKHALSDPSLNSAIKQNKKTERSQVIHLTFTDLHACIFSL